MSRAREQTGNEQRASGTHEETRSPQQVSQVSHFKKQARSVKEHRNIFNRSPSINCLVVNRIEEIPRVKVFIEHIKRVAFVVVKIVGQISDGFIVNAFVFS